MACTVSLILAVSLWGRAFGHVPGFSGDKHGFDEAVQIDDAAKSWAFYGELHEEREAQYYRLDLGEGDRIYLEMLVPTDPLQEGFVPNAVLMGPGLSAEGSPPEYVYVPDGYTAVLIEGEMPAKATYEGFSPSSFYSVADFEVAAPRNGTYYVAVYGASRAGRYSLVVGYRESFSLSEWILVPISLISVYRWEGQGLPAVFGPMALTSAIGAGMVVWRLRSRRTWSAFRAAATAAGLLFLGSGMTILFQMTITIMHSSLSAQAIVTTLLAIIPILLGIGALRIGLGTWEDPGRSMRLKLALVGLLALFAWAGLIVGPALCIVGSMLPAAAGKRAGI
jgi:hypothetical protein